MKICSGFQREPHSQPLSQFNANRASRDGLQSRCRKCHKAQKVWREDNPAGTISPAPEGMAWCSGWRDEERHLCPLAEFTPLKRPTASRSVAYRCKACSRADIRAWKAANQGKVKADNAAWRAKNPGYSAKWRAKNPERVKARWQKWAAANPGKVKAGWRKWAAANPEKVKANNARAYRKRRDKAKAAETQGRALLSDELSRRFSWTAPAWHPNAGLIAGQDWLDREGIVQPPRPTQAKTGAEMPDDRPLGVWEDLADPEDGRLLRHIDKQGPAPKPGPCRHLADRR